VVIFFSLTLWRMRRPDSLHVAGSRGRQTEERGA
jgi:hypothetical protein